MRMAHMLRSGPDWVHWSPTAKSEAAMNPLLLMLMAAAGRSAEDLPNVPPPPRAPRPPEPAGGGDSESPDDSKHGVLPQHQNARYAADGAGGGGATPRFTELRTKNLVIDDPAAPEPLVAEVLEDRDGRLVVRRLAMPEGGSVALAHTRLDARSVADVLTPEEAYYRERRRRVAVARRAVEQAVTGYRKAVDNFSEFAKEAFVRREVPPLKVHRLRGPKSWAQRQAECPRRHVQKEHERVCGLCRKTIPALGSAGG